MNPIDNSNLINYRGTQPAGFIPSVSYVYDAAAKTVTVTDGSTIPAGDTLSKVHVRIADKFGGEVRDAITVTAGPGAKVLDVSTLDASKGLDLRATVLTTKHIAADGGAYGLAAAGNASSWDTQQNA